MQPPRCKRPWLTVEEEEVLSSEKELEGYLGADSYPSIEKRTHEEIVKKMAMLIEAELESLIQEHTEKIVKKMALLIEAEAELESLILAEENEWGEDLFQDLDQPNSDNGDFDVGGLVIF